MTRPHRAAHVVLWLAVATACIAVGVLATGARPEPAPASILPRALDGGR